MEIDFLKSHRYLMAELALEHLISWLLDQRFSNIATLFCPPTFTVPRTYE